MNQSAQPLETKPQHINRLALKIVRLKHENNLRLFGCAKKNHLRQTIENCWRLFFPIFNRQFVWGKSRMQCNAMTIN